MKIQANLISRKHSTKNIKEKYLIHSSANKSDFSHIDDSPGFLNSADNSEFDTIYQVDWSVKMDLNSEMKKSSQMDRTCSVGSRGNLKPCSVATSVSSESRISYNCSNNSNESNASSDENTRVRVKGYLFKWTNYLYGWQKRYVVLKGKYIYYYRDKNYSDFLCKGSFNVSKITITENDYDAVRFDLKFGKHSYFLRANTVSDKNTWIKHIKAAREFYSRDKGSLSASGSLASLNSISNVSQEHDSGVNEIAEKKNVLNLTDRLVELDNFKEQIYQHIDTIESLYGEFSELIGTKDVGIDLYESDEESNFDYVKKRLNKTKLSTDNGDDKSEENIVHCCSTCEKLEKIRSKNIDIVGNAMSFRIAASGLMSIMTHCIETINSKYESWKKALDKEKDKKRRLLQKYKDLADKQQHFNSYDAGPDYVEGPHSKLNATEFYDAYSSALEVEAERKAFELTQKKTENLKETLPLPKAVEIKYKKNVYKKEVEPKINAVNNILTEPLGNDGSWEVVLESDNTKIYKKTVEIGNIVADPVRVFSSYTGVSAFEVAESFYDPKLKLRWDVQIDKVNMLDVFGETSCVYHQLQKHIWPASRRDVCLYSELSKTNTDHYGVKMLELYLEENNCEKKPYRVGPCCIVHNVSVEHKGAYDPNCTRAMAQIGIMCQSFTYKSHSEKISKLRRKDIFTRIHYYASINPGGWIPAAALRAFAKREFSKFVKILGADVTKRVENTPIRWE